MADSHVNVTEGSGKSIDSRTNADGHHRQVVVLGHESATDSVATVQATDPASNAIGLVVRDPLGTLTYGLMDGSGIRIRSISDGTVSVGAIENITRVKNLVDGTLTTVTGITNTVRIGASDGTLAVYFSPGVPAIRITDSGGAIAQVDSSYADGESNSNNHLDVGSHMSHFNGTTWDRTRGGSGVSDMALRVVHATDVGASMQLMTGANDVGNIVRVKNLVDGTLTLVTTVNRVNTVVDGTMRVGNITGSTLQVNVGTIAGTTAVYLHSTSGTQVVKIARESAGVGIDDSVFTQGTGTGVPIMGLFDDSSPDSVDENDVGVLRMTGNRLLMNNIQATAGIFTVSGTTSTAGNNTLVSPSASYSFKVFAYSIQTTGIVSSAPRFTTGASAGATELWRPLINSVQTSSTPVGANFGVSPPAYLFATGVSTTLSLYLDTGTLVHYSVSFIKESA